MFLVMLVRILGRQLIGVIVGISLGAIPLKLCLVRTTIRHYTFILVSVTLTLLKVKGEFKNHGESLYFGFYWFWNVCSICSSGMI